jgi:hypothetical protein
MYYDTSLTCTPEELVLMAHQEYMIMKTKAATPATQSPATPREECIGHGCSIRLRSSHQSRINTTTANMFIITLAFTAHCCHGDQSNTQLCTTLKLATKTNLITKANFYELAPEDEQAESLIDLNVDLEYNSSYVYVHRSNNELVEINKDVDESEEDAGNGTNDDNGLLGNSDKYDCNQITGYENDQWIAEHMLEEVPSSNARFHLWEFLICSNQHPVLPWSMITNGTSRGDKKAPPWKPRLL